MIFHREEDSRCAAAADINLQAVHLDILWVGSDLIDGHNKAAVGSSHKSCNEFVEAGNRLIEEASRKDLLRT